MIFQRGVWGLDLSWLKGSATGFGFEICCIFDPFLHCSRLFFILVHDETRTNMFGHNFSTGGWGLDPAWLKGSGTGFGFKIRCIFDTFLPFFPIS